MLPDFQRIRSHMTTRPDPTPFELFSLDPVRRDRMKAILADPLFTEAVNIVDDLMSPKAGATTDSNQPLTIARFHQCAGANEFQKHLKSLTREPVERRSVTPRKLAETADDLPE